MLMGVVVIGLHGWLLLVCMGGCSRRTWYVAYIEELLVELHGSIQAVPFAAENPAANKKDHHPE